jgi:hypothetical protein
VPAYDVTAGQNLINGRPASSTSATAHLGTLFQDFVQ